MRFNPKAKLDPSQVEDFRWKGVADPTYKRSLSDLQMFLAKWKFGTPNKNRGRKKRGRV